MNKNKLLVKDISILSIFAEDFNTGHKSDIDEVKFDFRGTYNSAEDLIKTICRETGLFENFTPHDFRFIDGYIYADMLVNKDIDYPNENDLELWEKGEEIIYSADLCVRILFYPGWEISTIEASDLGFSV